MRAASDEDIFKNVIRQARNGERVVLCRLAALNVFALSERSPCSNGLWVCSPSHSSDDDALYACPIVSQSVRERQLSVKE